MSSTPGRKITIKNKTYGLQFKDEQGKYNSYLVVAGYHLFKVSRVFRSSVSGQEISDDHGIITTELTNIHLPSERCIYYSPDLICQEVTAEQVICG